MSRDLACVRLAADSGSDLEEQPLPLMSRKQGGSVRLGLCASLLLVAVGMVGLASHMGFASGIFEDVQSSHFRKTAALSGTMQAFALERLGRTLNDDEIAKLYSHVSGGAHPNARALMDRFAMEDGHSENHDGSGVKLSPVCVNAINDKMKQAFKSFAPLLIEAFFGCVLGDEKSGACTVTTDKMDHFFDDMVETCKGEGDFCNVTLVDKQDSRNVVDWMGACVPKVCHSEAKGAIEYFNEQLGQQIAEAQANAQVRRAAIGELQAKPARQQSDECANCTVDIACDAAARDAEGPMAAVGDADQVEDLEHLKL